MKNNNIIIQNGNLVTERQKKNHICENVILKG